MCIICDKVVFSCTQSVVHCTSPRGYFTHLTTSIANYWYSALSHAVIYFPAPSLADSFTPTGPSGTNIIIGSVAGAILVAAIVLGGTGWGFK